MDPTEAGTLRGMLEASGISVMLSFESAARLEGVTCGPMAEDELVAPAAQAEAARQILADNWAGCLEAQG